jgi:hypothetical protein
VASRLPSRTSRDMAARGCRRRADRPPNRPPPPSDRMGESHGTRCHQRHRSPLSPAEWVVSAESEAYCDVAEDRPEVGASPGFGP